MNQLRRWTVLIYMAADGQKDPAIDAETARSALEDLMELRAEGSSPSVGIGVHLDLSLFRPIRFAIGRKGAVKLNRPLPESNTGKPSTLSAFLRWGQEQLEAERYLLVVWGHGLGVGFQLEIRVPPTLADVAFDQGDGLTPRELGSALARFKKERGSVAEPGPALEVLGFDACFMSTVEISLELQDLVDRVVATQDLIPFEGWPYGKIIRRLKSNPGQSGAAVARMVAKEVMNSYPNSTNITQTVVNPGSGNAVVDAFKTFVQALEVETGNPGRLRATARAMRQAKFRKAREFVDLADLCRCVVKASPMPATRKAARQVIAALDHSPQFIDAHHTHGRSVKRLNGVSIYFERVPPSRVGNVKLDLEEYRKLKFVKETRWQEFVDTLPPRR